MLTWYVMRSKPNKEELLYQQLLLREIDTYYPSIQVHPVNPRSLKIKPYFPGYLFIRTNLEIVGISTLQWLPGAIDLVNFGTALPRHGPLRPARPRSPRGGVRLPGAARGDRRGARRRDRARARAPRRSDHRGREGERDGERLPHGPSGRGALGDDRGRAAVRADHGNDVGRSAAAKHS